MPTKLIVALDTNDIEEACTWGAHTRPHADAYKIGLEYFLSTGVEGYRRIAAFQRPIMLDLKLHDIPNTVAGAVKALVPLKPAFLTVHASGGPAMIRAAREAATESSARPKILAVTVLTSLSEDDLNQIGMHSGVLHLVRKQVGMALRNGADGLVCSVAMALAIRAEFGPSPLLVCPGIRLPQTSTHDQSQVATPRAAAAAGADWIVGGRSITEAPDTAAAAEAMAAELVAS